MAKKIAIQHCRGAFEGSAVMCGFERYDAKRRAAHLAATNLGRRSKARSGEGVGGGGDNRISAKRCESACDSRMSSACSIGIPQGRTTILMRPDRAHRAHPEQGPGGRRPAPQGSEEGPRCTVTKTFPDGTLPGGPVQRTIAYHVYFVRPDRGEDYRVAWAFFEREQGVTDTRRPCRMREAQRPSKSSTQLVGRDHGDRIPGAAAHQDHLTLVKRDPAVSATAREPACKLSRWS